MVVDAFVYRKHCKFCTCTVALTLQLKHQTNGDEHGNYIAKESCNGRITYGQACDYKQALLGGGPDIYVFFLLSILSLSFQLILPFK
jgi:hypothetical protein